VERRRPRELGVVIGTMPTGALNAVLHALPIDRTLEILEKYGRPPKT
jgi:hypothetical protein